MATTSSRLWVVRKIQLLITFEVVAPRSRHPVTIPRLITGQLEALPYHQVGN